jgi:hypothetical protein
VSDLASLIPRRFNQDEIGEIIRGWWKPPVFGADGFLEVGGWLPPLGDFARKASLVWATSKGAKNADGSEATAQWKDKVEATIKRVTMTIEFASPTPCCSRTLTVRYRGKVTGRDGVTWSRDEFAAKIQYLNALAEELRSLNGELRTFNTIPDLGWMPSGSFEPMYLRPMSAALTVIGSQPVVIVEDTTKK